MITNGFGAMQGYAEQIPVRDRWLIAAYVRALQFSQNASVDDVPADRPRPRSTRRAAPPDAPARRRRSTDGKARGRDQGLGSDNDMTAETYNAPEQRCRACSGSA